MAEVEEAALAVNPKRVLAVLAVAAGALLKLPKLVSCFIFVASDTTSEVCETGANAVEGIEDSNLNTGAAGVEEVSETGAAAVEAVDDTNLYPGSAGADIVSATGATAVEAVEDPNLNRDAANAVDVSETGAAAVGVEDTNLNTDAAVPEEAGVEVEKLLVLEANESVVAAVILAEPLPLFVKIELAEEL